jgi:hypothetical protein
MLSIATGTLCGWQAALAELAKPLVERMKFLVLQSKVIHTDDTSIKMLQPGRGTTRTCKFWPYLGDWLHPYAVYDFTLNRERDGPAKFLEDYRGYLRRTRIPVTIVSTRALRLLKLPVGFTRVVTGIKQSTTSRFVPTRHWDSSRACRRSKRSFWKLIRQRTWQAGATLPPWRLVANSTPCRS